LRVFDFTVRPIAYSTWHKSAFGHIAGDQQFSADYTINLDLISDRDKDIGHAGTAIGA
jgi:hypothetical protein